MKLHYTKPISLELRQDVLLSNLDLEAEIKAVVRQDMQKLRDQLKINVTNHHIYGAVSGVFSRNWLQRSYIEICINHTTPELRNIALSKKTRTFMKELLSLSDMPADLVLSIAFYRTKHV